MNSAIGGRSNPVKAETEYNRGAVSAGVGFGMADSMTIVSSIPFQQLAVAVASSAVHALVSEGELAVASFVAGPTK
jgi:hypothetical protein